MTRFTTTTIAALALSALIGLPALAERPSINRLNAAVNQLEAENTAQQTEIDALIAEADTAPIVVDRTEEILGPVLVLNRDESAQVQFDLPDLPLFYLTVAKNRIAADGVTLWFESDDCTGQAWVDGFDATRGVTAYVRAITVALTGIRTFYVSNPSDSPQMISRRSWDQNDGVCESSVAQVSAGRVTPVDLDEMFTPPFRVTTWERMQAQP